MDAPPLLEGGVLDIAAGADAGIVDERVEAAEGGCRGAEIGDPLLLAGDVVREEDGAGPMRRAASSPRARSISAIATLAPSAAKASAMASPRPDAPPVMNAALPWSRCAIMPSLPALLFRRQPIVLELLAQPGLQHLAGRPMRQLRHDDDVVGQLPARDLAAEEGGDRSPCSAGSPASARRRAAAARPISGCGRPITAASAISGWPMAAFSRSIELIHSPPDLITSLLRSTMMHVAVAVDRRHVAGAEPALRVERRRRSLIIVEIAADDPRAAHQQLADSICRHGAAVCRRGRPPSCRRRTAAGPACS